MGTLAAHDIVVHYLGRKVRIPNIDPKRYSYIDLLGDVTERALNDMPANLGILVHMRCAIPRTFNFLDIIDDQSVMEMFRIHQKELVVNLHVFHLDIIPGENDNMLQNNDFGVGQENLGIENQPIRENEEHIENENKIVESSSDESWKCGLSSDLEGVLSDDNWSLSSNDKSGSDFSNFEENEDGIIMPNSESDGEVDPIKALARAKMWTYNARDEIEFQKGMLFTNVDAFRAALKDYVIQKGFPLMRLKNEKKRVTAKCAIQGCNWRIHASPVAGTTTFMIKSYSLEHNCVMNRKNVKATSDWITKKLVSVLRHHPEMTTQGILAEMRKYGVQPSRMQVYRARNKALSELDGSHADSYNLMPKYAELLRIHNPSSIMKIHFDRPNLLVEPKFLRLFISFKVQKDGFLAGCRHFIGFDGCHLKGPFGGVLLTAIALDGNNSLFPLAFVVAESENKETWSWFFHFFEEYYGPFVNTTSLMFMSDRQKGLNLAYEEKVPSAKARYCCWHIYSNFRKQFPGLLLKSYFWQASKSYDIQGHTEAMERIKEINNEAWRYLSRIPASAWARHAFSVDVKCDHVTNNFTESFNAWVSELRGKPILTLADGLRAKFMKKLHKRYQKGCTWASSVTPYVIEKLKGIAKKSRRCELLMASDSVFEVRDEDKTYIVKLDDKSCDCGAFQITGIPCRHAALGIVYRREKLETYCDIAFSRELYLKAYASMIQPIPHVTRWPSMDNVTPKTVLPPPLRRAPGRPRKNRRRDADEGPAASQANRSTTLKCSNCGLFGHNKRTCQRAPVAAKKGTPSTTNPVANRRGKPGRGTANTGLSGALLWEHASGLVPIVVSNQGSHPSLPSQETSLNFQVNVAVTTGAKKKRGRTTDSASTSNANQASRVSDNSPTTTIQLGHPIPASQIERTVSMNTAATMDSHSINSNF